VNRRKRERKYYRNRWKREREKGSISEIDGEEKEKKEVWKK
jgi:hypothetical protein